MPLNVDNCPLCDEKQSTLFDRRNFRGYQVSNRLCLNCGFIYQSPRMNEPELDSFYEHEYRKVYQGSQEPIQKDLLVQSKRAESLIKVLEDSGIENVDRHLDIGCSSGILLERVAKQYHCQGVGVEPGEAYRTYAEDQGLKVYATLQDVKNAGEQKFDLITIIHVLEHLPNPVDYLNQLKGTWLKSDGILLIEVPNLYAHNSFEVAHLASFSQFTLEETLRKAGYSKQFLSKHGRPRSMLIPLYITLLATPVEISPGENEVRREGGIRLKRRAGMAHRRIIERLFPKQAWLPEFHS
jgi:2-polyprenyl-3-methyl-5-hydroxy-6-metoxy-1,4-benzoquinol methylase